MCPNCNTKICVEAVAWTRLSWEPRWPPRCLVHLASIPMVVTKGHPLLWVEVISVFRAAKTYTSAKTASSEHQKSLGESVGTSEKIILARLPVWKCSLLPHIRGEWKLLFWEKPLGIGPALWVRFRNKANCRCHSHRSVLALGQKLFTHWLCVAGKHSQWQAVTMEGCKNDLSLTSKGKRK